MSKSIQGAQRLLEPQQVGSVGGSTVMVIEPSILGLLEEMQDRSDRLVRACKGEKPRPGGMKSVCPVRKAGKKCKGGDVKILQSHCMAHPSIATRSNVDIEAERNAFNPNLGAMV